MDFNLKVEEIKNKITQLMEESNLPISMIYYMFSKLFHDLELSYQQYIIQAYEQQNKEHEDNLEN